ncbi:hypothetical protein BST61_g6571 [Cercospora zeina]
MGDTAALCERLASLPLEPVDTSAQNPPLNKEMDETTALSARMMALPQELFDEIYDRTFTANKKTRQIISASTGRPPHLLHIDRRSREKFAASYYRNTTFLVADHYVFGNWMEALDHVPPTAFGGVYLRTNYPWWVIRPTQTAEIVQRWRELGDSFQIIRHDSPKNAQLIQEAKDDENVP